MKLSQASSTGGSFAVSKQLIYNEQLIQERKSIKQSCLRKEVILLSSKFIQMRLELIKEGGHGSQNKEKGELQLLYVITYCPLIGFMNR